MNAPTRHGPWDVADNLGRVTVSALAVLGMVIAWVAVSGEERFIPQLKWLTFGVAALVVAGIADGLWLLAGMRAIRERRRAVVLAGSQVAANAPALTVDGGRRRYVTAARTDLYHDAGCPLVLGKAVRAASAAVHERQRRRPCPMCVR